MTLLENDFENQIWNIEGLKVVALKTALALCEYVLLTKNNLNLNNNLVNRAPNV